MDYAAQNKVTTTQYRNMRALKCVQRWKNKEKRQTSAFIKPDAYWPWAQEPADTFLQSNKNDI